MDRIRVFTRAFGLRLSFLTIRYIGPVEGLMIAGFVGVDQTLQAAYMKVPQVKSVNPNQ